MWDWIFVIPWWAWTIFGVFAGLLIFGIIVMGSAAASAGAGLTNMFRR